MKVSSGDAATQYCGATVEVQFEFLKKFKVTSLKMCCSETNLNLMMLY